MPTIWDLYRWFLIKSELYRTKQWNYTKRAICKCQKCWEEKDRIVSSQMVCGNCKYVERIFDRWDYYDIALSNGWFTSIDKCDLNKIKNYLWYKTIRNSVEARVGGKLVKLHRFILSPKPWEHVDHINWNTADNRRINIRICTQAENNRNIWKRKWGTSRYKYVYRNYWLWIARMEMFWNYFYKSFKDERDAAIWIDKQIEGTWDKFKKTNKMLWLL